MYILGGLLDSYSEDDFRSDDLEELYGRARELSTEDYEAIFGIWANEGDDLLAIAHNGDLFLLVKA